MKLFKKVISTAIALTMALTLAFSFGCGPKPTPAPAKSITLDKTEVSISLFNNDSLTATLQNIDAEVEWSNSDESIVIMTETVDGVNLYAVKAGTATITATADGKSATCAVTVTGNDPLLLVRNSEKSVTVTPGSQITIDTSLTYMNSPFTKDGVVYTYSVSDASPEGCVVLENGVAVAKSAGTAKVSIVASYYGNQSNTQSVDVTVFEVENTLTFGQHDEFPFVVNGAIATMSEDKTLAFEGATLTGNKNDSVIRFQIVSPEDWVGDSNVEYYAPAGVENVFITVQDAADPENFVTVHVGSINVSNSDAGGPYYSHSAVIGVTTSMWTPDYDYNSDAQVFQANKFSGAYAKDEAGWIGWNLGINGYSFYNAWLDSPKVSSLDENMISIGFEGTSVYFHINGEILELANLASTGSSAAWPGFSGNSVNVYVTTDNFGSAGYSDLVVDTIGATAVNETNFANFEIVDLAGKLVPAFTAHTCSAATEYSYDAENHWYACVGSASCTKVFDLATHTLDGGICTVCGWHEHVFADTYTIDGGVHYKACTIGECAERSEEAAHDFTSGDCVCGKASTLKFGQTAEWAHDSVLAVLSAGEKLTISNVTLPTVSETGLEATDALARFTMIPEQLGLNVFNGFKCSYGAQSIYITVSDAANADNFFKILIIHYNTDGPGTHAIVGGFASSYGEIVNGKYAATGNGGNGCSEGGWTHSGYGTDTGAFSFSGGNLGDSDYTWGMMGLVFDGTEVSYQTANTKLHALGDFSQDISGYTAETPWAGFSGPVNITFELGRFANGATTTTLAFDVVGGVALTADSLSQFSIA